MEIAAHEPEFAYISAMTKRFNLPLSGNSHGGQVRLHSFKALILPPLGEKYYLRRYQVGEMIQYTNRGVSMSGLHLRLGACLEIAVFTLVALRK
ncbi:hypothetical protein [Nostoc sp. T09]|uniref:hypothetical protein n=1 Tax=Nostoc sp. T09 TaxID=1932621 RepID=UPI001C4F0D3A|nr:hypothetical protein [Nostoc sp. T09]